MENPGRPIGRLRVIEGPEAGREIMLGDGMVLGRDDSADVVLVDPSGEISRRHARFGLRGDTVVLEDLDSTNGTSLGGERIRGPRVLSDGDRIRIGANTVEFWRAAGPAPGSGTGELRIIAGPGTFGASRTSEDATTARVTGGSATIGREPECDLQVLDPEVSRRHAKVTVQDGVAVIEDLHSANGTYVNGERILGRKTLARGDHIQIGEATIELTSPALERTAVRGRASPGLRRARRRHSPGDAARFGVGIAQMVDAGRRVYDHVHAAARCDRRFGGAALDLQVTASPVLLVAVDHRRLHPHPHRWTAHRRLVGGHLRAQAPAQHWRDHLHARLDRVRHGAAGDRARLRPWSARARRGGHVRLRPRADHAGVPGGRARRRVRRVRGGHRDRGRRRSDRRRATHPGVRLAVDLLPERSDRPRGVRGAAAQGGQPARAADDDRLGRPRHLLGSDVPRRLRDDPWQRRGLDEPADPRLLRGCRGAAGRVPRDRAAARTADVRPHPVSQSHLHRLIAGRDHDGRDAARAHLLHHHMAAVDSRLLTDRRRSALPRAVRADAADRATRRADDRHRQPADHPHPRLDADRRRHPLDDRRGHQFIVDGDPAGPVYFGAGDGHDQPDARLGDSGRRAALPRWHGVGKRGTTVGIAVLGTLLQHQISVHVHAALKGTSEAANAASVASQISVGNTQQLIASAAPSSRALLRHTAHLSYAAGLREIFFVGFAAAALGGVSAVLLIHKKYLRHDAVGANAPSDRAVVAV